MAFLVSTAIVLLLILLLIAYIPQRATAASGSGINVPRQWHNGRVVRLRVATYNIHRGRGQDGREDLSRIAEVIRGNEIIALQEVGTSGLPRRSQAQQLAKQLDMGWLYVPTRYRWFHYDRGDGLLSVFPVNHWHSERLPHSERRTPRALTSARVLVGGKELWVLVTHLNTRDGRPEQLRIVLDRFRHYSPAILLGDLNTAPDDPVMVDYLRQEEVVDTLAVTLGPEDSGQRVDWILARGLEVKRGGTENSIASDHPFYWIELNSVPSKAETN